jgi:hypothetical protein
MQRQRQVRILIHVLIATLLMPTINDDRVQQGDSTYLFRSQRKPTINQVSLSDARVL